MNRKGIIPFVAIAFALVIVIAGIAIVIGVFNSKAFVILASGITLVVLTLIYIVPKAIEGNLTRQKIGLVLVFIFLGVIIIFISQMDFINQSAVTSSTFVKPIWGRLECAEQDVYSTKAIYQITTNFNSPQNKIYCGQDELVEECRIFLGEAGPQWNSDSVRIDYKICQSSNNACGSQVNDVPFTRENIDQYITTLSNGQYIQLRVESGIFGIDTEATIKKDFKPFKLYDFFSGGKRTVNDANCNIPITDSGTGEAVAGKRLAEDTYTNQGQQCVSSIAKGSWCNYVHDWAYGPASNVFTHPSYGEVYCTGGTIYGIVELTTQNNQNKKVDPLYSGVKADGTTINGLGQNLGQVACCPNQPGCTANFEWTSQGGNACTTDAQCRNGGSPFFYGPGQTVRELCQSNVCTLQTPTNVQCASDNDCPSGQFCAVGSTWTCGEYVGPGGGIGEQTACEAKAEKNPLFGYEWVTVTEEPSIWKKIVTLGQAKATTSGYCKATFLIYYVLGVVSLVFLTIIVLLLKPSKKKRK